MASAPQHTIANGLGLTVSVTDRGRFDIADRRLDWLFAGHIGSPIADATLARGRDRAGAYREIAFAFAGPKGAARRGAIRLYDRRGIVLFEHKFIAPGTSDEAFPSLSQYPRGLHHLSYTGIFGKFSFRRFGADGPWAFFDDRGNTLILSPASHFMNASLRRGTNGQLSSGIVASDRRVPAGFVHRTVLAIAPGINAAFESWGHFLTDLTGKKRPANDADAGLKYLGYWTDHGARYYYRWAAGSDYHATLLQVRDAFRKAGIGIGYMQLDSWFYRKGHEGRWRSGDRLGGGTYLYEASTELFPDGLSAFQKQLRLPLITHNRWLDAKSPYRARYAISGNVIVDPALWAKLMRYLRASGVRTYEQDWLSGPALPERTLDAGERFLDTMAAAARREGIALQYCMPLPRHFLQGAKYGNLTTIRTSGDRLRAHHWKSFLFNGRLATALGAWPWTDVFASKETANLLLATLSGGMVGVGDAIGKLDGENLRRAVRADGVIVKPDAPLTPLDRSYIAQAKDRAAPVVAVARTNHDGWIASYVLAFGGTGRRHPEALPTAALGYDGPVYAYDYFGKAGVYLEAGETLRFSVGRDPAYWLVVPVTASGIGFLGDAGKFVSTGRKRVTRVADNGTLSARIAFARGEDRIRLHGFARRRPELAAQGGSIENMIYDARRGLFEFDLVARPGASPTITARSATARRRDPRRGK
ncbi:MAG TPA: hypothetical protein VH020_13525 [Stellaceae bacterium]|nr:hypothetical protein [Stellaceae bacterium]